MAGKGWMYGVAAGLLLALCSCGGGGGGGGADLLVVAMVVNGVPGFNTVATVTLTDVGVAVTDATVTVNTVNVPHVGNGEYKATDLLGGSTFNVGDNVVLAVSWRGASVGGTLQAPEQPTVIGPTGSQSVSKPITVTWNALSLLPDSVWLMVDGDYTVSGTEWTATVGGSRTSAQIPAGTLKTGKTGVTVMVTSMNITSSLGADAEPYSYYAVNSSGFSPAFNTVP